MLQMRSIISRFLADRSGATAVEYGILVAVLSLTIVAGVENAGNSLQNMWGRIASSLDESWN
jgi:pilus assembly protein Flp/PilA